MIRYKGKSSKNQVTEKFLWKTQPDIFYVVFEVVNLCMHKGVINSREIISQCYYYAEGSLTPARSLRQ